MESDSIALWVQAAGAVLAFAVAFAAFTNTHWARVTASVRAAVVNLTSTDLAKARDEVAAASRKRRLSRAERLRIRHSALVLLWEIERLVVLRQDAKTPIAWRDVRILYLHVDSVIEDLSQLFARHPDIGDFEDAIDRVNKTLDSLPDLSTAWRKLKRTAPQQRLSASR